VTLAYTLHKNPLTNGANNYRGVVQFAGTVDLEGVIERMIARGSTITKADALAVLQDYHDTINDLVLQGFKVVTPGANYGISLRGNFAGQTDSFDSSRHQAAALVNPGLQFRPFRKTLITVNCFSLKREKYLSPAIYLRLPPLIGFQSETKPYNW